MNRAEIDEDITCRADWFEDHYCAADAVGTPSAWLYVGGRALMVLDLHDVVVVDDEAVTVTGLDEAGRVKVIDGLVGELELHVWSYRSEHLAEILE